MNPIKLMAAALCAAASVTTTAFAEDDFGIESASPEVVADPINPQPGMIFSAYGPDRTVKNNEAWLKESNSKLPKIAAMKTGVDKGEKFSIDVASGVKALTVRWEGFMKCKRAATYTFLFQKGLKSDRSFHAGYSIKINGKSVVPAGSCETTCDASLKVGWNKVEIVSIFGASPRVGVLPLNVSFKPKDSLSEPRPLAPKDLYHDQKPEEDW
ncbi:MAG: hypothetical protein IKQ17_08820 [Kiritimatiellae bacterium]|nr:hypothetical protein [Kiritimatiellia bacterium]